jgi:WD40 repeat protein
MGPSHYTQIGALPPTVVVTAVAFSHDGKTLATAASDGTARLWDLATRGQIGAPFGSGADTAAFSPDGKTQPADK